jgi:hypothetical protein
MESRIAREWMDCLARSANARDYAAHMELVSSRVQVYGMPGFEVLGYADWAAQCRHEFETGILKSYRYEGIKVRAMTPLRIMFETRETVESTDGMVNTMLTEILIEKELDGKWRVVQEKIHHMESSQESSRG